MPRRIVLCILVGLIAGFLAGRVMRGSGFGLIADIVLGLIGAFVGGLILRQFVTGMVGFWGSVGIAFVGACIILAVVRIIAPARRW